MNLTAGGGGELLWLDLEFTGLRVKEDRITEVGAIVTDFGLRELSSYHSFVYSDPDLLRPLFDANPWWENRQEQKEEMLRNVALRGRPLSEVDTGLTLLARSMDRHPVVIAGNSIHNDRRWVDEYMHDFSSELHYRMVDVSAFKIIANGLLGVEFNKQEAHRSLDDIRESIAEIKFLLPHLATVDYPKLFGQE